MVSFYDYETLHINEEELFDELFSKGDKYIYIYNLHLSIYLSVCLYVPLVFSLLIFQV